MILFAKIIQPIYACIRRLHYAFLSEASYEGRSIKGAFLLTYGKRRICFDSGVRLDWIRKKAFENYYNFCEARELLSQSSFENKIWIGKDLFLTELLAKKILNQSLNELEVTEIIGAVNEFNC